jgi:SAM-dependent methyltransferase
VAEQLRALGHHVTGVDLIAHEGVKERVDRFIEADLDHGVPPQVEGPFDVVLAADVLEHVRHPDRILEQVAPLLAPDGTLVTSVPNFGHWYPRARVALGRFDYDRRGILDRDHIRFFTRLSFERLATRTGYTVLRRTSTGLPLEVVGRGGAGSRPGGLVEALSKLDRAATRIRPGLFAYQFLYELRPTHAATLG